MIACAKAAFHFTAEINSKSFPGVYTPYKNLKFSATSDAG